MSSPKNYGLSDSLISKVTEICEMSSNRAREYLKASTAQARELQGKIYTPDATEADKRKYRNRSKYFSKALKRSRSIGEDEDMTAEKNYGLSDALIESARAILTKSSETLDEGRGRPRKTPLAAGEEEGNEPDQNIIMQLRKVQSLRGAKPVSFRDGSKHTVHMADALKAIRMHGMMRTSIEKGNFENKIAKSHADFKHHIGSTIKDGGSEEEKKSKVTLPAVDRLKAKGKLEEGFRPNQKVKFKHSDGSWKSGYIEDYETYGVTGGQGAAKHNPNDHATREWGHEVSYDMDGKGKRGLAFIAKANIKLHEEQIDEAKPDFHYQEWPGKKPKKAFNLSKYLENSDKRTKAREKLNDDAKNKKGFFKEDEQLDELSIDTMYRYKNKAGAEYHRLNNYGGSRGAGMNRRHSNRQNGIDLANERIHAGPRTKPGLRLAKLQGKVHPNAMKEQIGEASLDDVWKKAGKNYRMRLKSTDKPKPFTVGQHNDAVEARRAKAKTKPS